MDTQVLLLATLETKTAETTYLKNALNSNDIYPVVIDVSLSSGGEVWDSAGKLSAMEQVVEETIQNIFITYGKHLKNIKSIIGLGGGTGGELILRIMRALPPHCANMLVTPLPFDPRSSVADSSIVLIPSLVDICGLNETLRQVLRDSAAMVAGICTAQTHQKSDTKTSIAITALGAMGKVTDLLVQGVQRAGHEATVFHANGFGGAAYARFAEQGMFSATIDLTTHELTRLLFTGSHVPMPKRFDAASNANIPQIVLPGGLNFLGLESLETVPAHYLERPYYQHSGLFTHVKLTQEEMVLVAKTLAGHLSNSKSEAHLIVPMGGFSTQDAPGGDIEDLELREVFLSTIKTVLSPNVKLTQLESHISHPQTANCILDAVQDFY